MTTGTPFLEQLSILTYERQSKSVLMDFSELQKAECKLLTSIIDFTKQGHLAEGRAGSMQPQTKREYLSTVSPKSWLPPTPHRDSRQAGRQGKYFMPTLSSPHTPQSLPSEKVSKLPSETLTLIWELFRGTHPFEWFSS